MYTVVLNKIYIFFKFIFNNIIPNDIKENDKCSIYDFNSSSN